MLIPNILAALTLPLTSFAPTAPWTIAACEASTQVAADVTLTIKAENCRKDRFTLRSGDTMSWPGFSNDWYEPDISGSEKVVSLDSFNGSGTLVFSFSKPVTDPVLHIADLGGGVGGTPATWFTQRWNLVTPGLALERVSGNSRLEVKGSVFKARDVATLSPQCTGGFGCGSVRIKGTVTQAVFDIDTQAVVRCCPVKLDRTTFTVTAPEPAPAPVVVPTPGYAPPAPVVPPVPVVPVVPVVPPMPVPEPEETAY